MKDKTMVKKASSRNDSKRAKRIASPPKGKSTHGKMKVTFHVTKITEDQMTDEMKRAWNSVIDYLEESVSSADSNEALDQ